MGTAVTKGYIHTGQNSAHDYAAHSTRLLYVNYSENDAAELQSALQGFAHELLPASTMAEALHMLTNSKIDLIVVESSRPGTKGLELCGVLKKNAATQFLPTYVLGSGHDPNEEIRALEAGADGFLAKPLHPRSLQARLAASLRQKSRIDALDDSESVLFSLAQSVEDRDPDLGQHCHRLAVMGSAMGLTLGLSRGEILALERGGYLHDVGKVAVPDYVLFKPGPLTPSEWETMKTHTERGERICQGMKSLSSVLPIIRHHHERWDGSGYPDGLRGEQIPLLARILQLADIYDALTTARPYKEAMTAEQALQTIRFEARKGWRDPQLVDAFAEMLPSLRFAPMAAEHSRFSLRALAESLDRFQTYGGHAPLQAEDSAKARLRLVSGF